MKLVWDELAWDDYLWWQAQDRKVLRRINALIQDTVRNGNEGTGKPEALRHAFEGYWSRRITDEHPAGVPGRGGRDQGRRVQVPLQPLIAPLRWP